MSLILVVLLAYLAEKSPSFQGLLVLKEGKEKKRGEDVCPLSEVEFVQQVRDKKIFPVPLFPPCIADVGRMFKHCDRARMLL